MTTCRLQLSAGKLYLVVSNKTQLKDTELYLDLLLWQEQTIKAWCERQGIDIPRE